MKKHLRGFTFIEVILYIALFSLLGMAIFHFAWDMFDLSQKSHTEQAITEESLFVKEKIQNILRSASGINEAESVWGQTDGKLVIEILGSSDTLTLERINNQIVLTRTNETGKVLHPSRFECSALQFDFTKRGDGSIDSIGVSFTLQTPAGLSQEYSSSVSVETGVYLRNSGL